MTSTATPERTGAFHRDHPRYPWVALSNTTLGMLMATINSSIVIISLPAIFTGIKLNPLDAGQRQLPAVDADGLHARHRRAGGEASAGSATCIGRVRIYNLGFVVFTIGSIALAFDPFTGGTGALWLIVWRVVQGVGGAMLFANSTAILTDAFPANRRGLALGINQVAADRRLVHRPDPRRPAGGDRLARGVLRLASRSACSARSGRTSRCTRSAQETPGRIDWLGQPAVRGRPDRAARPGSRTASSPTAARRRAGATRGCSARSSAALLAAGRVRASSSCKIAVADVRHAAVPDPGVLRRATSPGCWPRSAEAGCSSC